MPKIQYILFDLDDTLYTGTSGLFGEVGQRIEQWTAQALGLSSTEARALRHEYFQIYGTTMAGLRQEHPEVDIDAYLDYVHAIDVAHYLDAHPALDAMLGRLKAPLAIFTNGIRDWAERITTRLGIRHHFNPIIDVRAVHYKSKPHPDAYVHALDILQVPATSCVLVDDQVSYLHGAAKAGMRTILVSEKSSASDGIDYAVRHVLETEAILQGLLLE